jgi:thiamine-phosphate pyrophosphorylase
MPPPTAFPVPCLMLVTDRELAGGADALVKRVTAAVEAGVNAVQLRENDLPEDDLADLAKKLRKATRGKALLIVNTSLDAARESHADGVHLPEAADAIERPSPDFLIGRSVHSTEAAEAAAQEGVDYLIVGAMYETRSHPGVTPHGVQLLSDIATAVEVPVLGIGGITAERVAQVMQAGASGIAVISYILGESSPAGATRMMREAVDAAAAGADRVEPWSG